MSKLIIQTSKSSDKTSSDEIWENFKSSTRYAKFEEKDYNMNELKLYLNEITTKINHCINTYFS